MRKSDLITREIIEREYIDSKNSLNKIGLKYGVSKSTVERRIRELGYKTRNRSEFGKQYLDNDSYFSLHSSRMFYTLGIITTDGCVMENRSKTTTVLVKYQAQEQDYELVKYIHDELCPDRPILKTSCLTKGIRHYKYAISIYSKKMCDDLAKWLVTPRKSLTLRCPSIPQEYKWDYLRGIFDGNGTFCIDPRKPKSGCFTIFSGSKLFLEDVQIHVLNETPSTIQKRKENVYALCINKKLDIKHTVDNMYNTNGFFLHRKYSKVLKWKESNGY